MLTRMIALTFATLATMTVVGCSSTDERGPVESTASSAGRAVDDSVITGKVKAALIADPTTKAHQIEVETYQGTVQLSGFVDSTAARSRASEIATNVEGVKSVKNSLSLRTAG
jgi:osmotically-inducible protein OsmY